LITTHLTPAIATTQGHLHQERQNLQSTSIDKAYDIQMERIRQRIKAMQALKSKGQTIEQMVTNEIETDAFPPSASPNTKTYDVVYVVIDKKEFNTAYTDITGRFPMRSSQGNQYILVGYHFDANCIHGIAIKDRTATTLTVAWQKLHDLFGKAGAASNNYVMDNEISSDLKDAQQVNQIT